MTDASSLIASFKKKEKRALARLISLAENREPELLSLLPALYPPDRESRVLGITGPPGAGKSTLTGTFIRSFRQKSESVGVVAVDPVSPFTGGSLLGDRIRLSEHFNDDEVFIRSLSTRGKLGGLSLATRETVHLMEAFGLNNIVVETVGVGQSEVDIRHIADLTLVVLVPEWGDAVQTLKAGLLEIGDLFVVNKSDREGAEKLETELQTMLALAGKNTDRVITASQQKPESLVALCGRIEKYFKDHAAAIREKRARATASTAADLVESYVAREARAWVETQSGAAGNPYKFMETFLKKHPPGSLFRP